MRTKKHLAAKEWTKSRTQTSGVAETCMRVSRGISSTEAVAGDPGSADLGREIRLYPIEMRSHHVLTMTMLATQLILVW